MLQPTLCAGTIALVLGLSPPAWALPVHPLSDQRELRVEGPLGNVIELHQPVSPYGSFNSRIELCSTDCLLSGFIEHSSSVAPFGDGGIVWDVLVHSFGDGPREAHYISIFAFTFRVNGPTDWSFAGLFLWPNESEITARLSNLAGGDVFSDTFLDHDEAYAGRLDPGDYIFEQVCHNNPEGLSAQCTADFTFALSPAVPEPMPQGLLVLGLLAVAAWRRAQGATPTVPVVVGDARRIPEQRRALPW